MPTYRNATCPACHRTGRAVDLGICDDCGRCSECCACSHVTVPHRAVRGRAPTFHGEPTAMFPRYVGVEMECGLTDRNGVGSPVSAALETWDAQAVSDGSVRDIAAPVEIVSSPARGDAFPAQIRDLCTAMAREGARVNKSCGLHVHVDARGATYADLCRLARVWAKVETGLFNMIAPSRRKSAHARQYCPPWGSTFDRAGVFLAESLTDKERTLDCAIYGSESAAASAKQAARAGHKYHGSRYRTLNLHSFHCHGTVENRMHHGSVDADKIIMWAAVTSAVVHYAFTHTDAEVFALRGTPAEILDRIVTSPAVRAWMMKRREKFAALRSRAHPGEPPRRRAPAVPAAPLPVVSAGPHEASEV